MGTPLNVIAGRAGLIASGKLSPEDSSESAAIIRTQSEQMTKIIRQLLDFSRQHSPRRVDVDLKNVVSQTLELLAPLAEKRNVVLKSVESALPMSGRVDVGQIQKVLTNLVINAIQAMPAGGNVEIGVDRRRVRPDDDSVLPVRLMF